MNKEIKSTINKVKQSRNISLEQLKLLLEINDDEGIRFIREEAVKVCQKTYGNQVLIRGLIEFTNFCKNDCYYCGIRRSNSQADRYRLTKEQMLDCCASGYELGFRTFVLQGGEDGYFTDDKICDLVSAIKEKYPDCAVTLSIGEKSKESYKRYFDAGADRYLLRHETADEAHYKKLHPEEMSLAHRKQCLWDLKEIGYQVGCGFMVGSPGQTVETLYEDLQFIRELQPHMVGIGPFISQKDTPFADKASGTMEQTLKLLAIIRLIHPHVLLPATTALGTIHPKGRELGILSGANVVMPNLSPVNVREKYEKTMKEKDSIVVVTADALQRDVLSKRGDSHLVFSCNGVDYNHFHNEIDPDFKFEKEFAEILEKGQPMIGYYGALAKWFDYQLVKELAETGKYQIVLFGIKYDDSYEKAGLDRQENVHFLGSRDYHVLQNYAAKMDVLTIPFLINEITKATSPVKLFEYMALNKPIVTTDMDECRKYQSVLIGHDHKEFEAKLDEALGKRSDKAYIELLDREALENTWEEKAKAIIEEMKHCEEADGNR